MEHLLSCPDAMLGNTEFANPSNILNSTPILEASEPLSLMWPRRDARSVNNPPRAVRARRVEARAEGDMQYACLLLDMQIACLT